MRQSVDVAIVGAGPYGLSISAHLSVAGVEHCIFGSPMQTWRSMPKGMFLKSLDFATNVYTPRRGFGLIDYCRSHGLSSAEPLAMETFARYGLWAQERLVPHLDSVDVARLAQPRGSGFEIDLTNGEQLSARRVVMATGLTYFKQVPEVLRGLPKDLATHTSEHRDYEDFCGKEVVVLGAGQSALEAAVMLHEAGARPQLVVRGGGASFASPPVNPRPLRHRLLYPMSVFGPGRLNFVLERVPFGAHYLPDASRVRLTRTHLGPWGSWWLAKRFEGKVPVIARTEVVRAVARDSRLALLLRDRDRGSEREISVDHIVAGTGYEPDLARIPFLNGDLARRVTRIERAPRLSANFETSVPGLYFVGAAAAFSFGPLSRFVCGARYTASVVSRDLERDRAWGRRSSQVPSRMVLRTNAPG